MAHRGIAMILATGGPGLVRNILVETL